MSSPNHFPLRPPSARLSLPGLAIVLVAHLAALAGLMTMNLAPALPEVPTLMVQVLPALSPSSMLQPMPPAAVRQNRVSEALPQARAAEVAPDVASPAAVSDSRPATHAASAQASAAPAGEVAVSAPRFDAAYLENPAPTYPALARRLGEEGKVWLRVHVEASGTPSRIEIKTSSGSPRLDQAAEQAVWRWKFLPAKRGNEALAAWVLVPVSFNLRG